MSEQWRKRTRTAFRFWEQLLKAWDEAQKSNELYAELITTLRRFEPQTADTFKIRPRTRRRPGLYSPCSHLDL